MNFSTYNDLNDSLIKTFNFPPQINKKLLEIFKKYNSSPLYEKIKNKIKLNKEIEKLKIYTISYFESYNLDRMLFSELLNVKENGVGPGEILISLLFGKWSGGTNNQYDCLINNLGKCEVKYLGPFVASSHVPFGSAENKNLLNGEFLNFLKSFYSFIKNNFHLLKGKLSSYGLNYFITKTFKELENGKLTTKSIRLIATIFKQNIPELISTNFTLKKYIELIEKSFMNSIGESSHVIFLGYKNIITNDINDPSQKRGGIYLVVPKDKIKYYMFYKMYDGYRMEISPLAKEEDFYKEK
jgi:hypothetical protein